MRFFGVKGAVTTATSTSRSASRSGHSAYHIRSVHTGESTLLIVPTFGAAELVQCVRLRRVRVRACCERRALSLQRAAHQDATAFGKPPLMAWWKFSHADASPRPACTRRFCRHCKKTRPSRAHSQARSGPCLDGRSSALRSAASQLSAFKQRTRTPMGSRVTLPTPLRGWSGAMRSFGCPALAHAGAVGRESELQDEL